MGLLMRRHTAKLNEDKFVDFGKMKVDELKTYAVSNGIELPKEANKADIISILKEG